MKDRMRLAIILIAGFLLFGGLLAARPVALQAASSHKAAKETTKARKKIRQTHFFRAGFEWDNHYLEAGKKIDLSKYVKGTSGLSKACRARLIRWKSSKSSIVSINRYGIAKAKKAGTCKIRCRMKTRKGWKTVTRKIRVFDSRKISFSVSVSLKAGNRYASKVKKTYNTVFDTVTIRVRNASHKPLVLKKDLLVLEPECSYVSPSDRYGTDVWMHSLKGADLTIPAGKTGTVTYQTDGALSYLKEDQKNNNTFLLLSFRENGSKKNLRYELPKGKMMITK